MRSIRSKFLVLILGCVLLAGLVLGGGGIWNTARVVDEDTEQILNLICEEKAQEIDALLQGIEQSVLTIHHYAEGQLKDWSDLQEDGGKLDAYVEKVREVALNAAESTEGAVAVYLRFEQELTPSFAGFFLTRSHGDQPFSASEITDLSKYDQDDMEHVGWYYAPIKAGKAIWIPPYENKNLDIYMISYTIPFYKDGLLVGVIGMDIDMGLLESAVSEVKIYGSGYGILANRDGDVYAHKDIVDHASREEFHAKADEIKKGSSGWERKADLRGYTWEGQKKKLAYQMLRNEMLFAVAVPAREIDASKTRLLHQQIVMLVLILILSVLLTLSITNRIIRPLKQLTKAAEQIAKGNLSVDISCRTKDEVGILAESFRRTVSHLKHYINYINNLAYQDGLTGLGNKTAYNDEIARLDARIEQACPAFAVVVLDINNLKRVNDSCGHEAGDQMILDAVSIIRQVFGDNKIYRIGGDEFVVILEPPYLELWRRYLDTLDAGTESFLSEEGKYEGGVSIARGIAVFDRETDHGYMDVFRRADAAMYEIKAQMKG